MWFIVYQETSYRHAGEPPDIWNSVIDVHPLDFITALRQKESDYHKEWAACTGAIPVSKRRYRGDAKILFYTRLDELDTDEGRESVERFKRVSG